MIRFWGITKLAKRITSRIPTKKGESYEVLAFLHEMKTASTSEIAQNLGISEGKATSILRQLKTKGLVKELTDASF